MARACLTLLLSLDGNVNKATIKSLPLAFYAARYRVGHAKSGNGSLHAREVMQRIFDPNEPYFSTWAWLEDYDERMVLIPEAPTTPKFPPLHRAAQDDLDDIAIWLITSRSQDPDELNGVDTPLFDASKHGSLKVAQLLIEHGVDVNPRCSSELRPLHLASLNDHPEISRLLIQNGADVNARTSGDWTALFMASAQGHPEAARVLLENGADSNLALHWGAPLSAALQRDHSEVTRLLLEYGADINARDDYGRTQLHRATSRADVKTVRLLLELGINIHARDGEGKMPLRLASASALEIQSKVRKDIVLLL